jgi:putative transposase
MRAPALIIADGAPGIWKATSELWPGAVEQRCTVHALRNITSKLPERAHREVKARYWAVLDEATSASDAKAGLLALAGDYRRPFPSAMRVIDDHVDRLVAHLRFRSSIASGPAAPSCSSAPSSRSAGEPRSSGASPARPVRCR